MKRERRKVRLDQSGTSMLFALLLFVVLLVLGINLMNAVYANTANTQKELQKQQTIAYIASTFDVVNQMITEGKFYDTAASKMPKQAEAVIKTAEDKDLSVLIAFKQKGSSLSAEVQLSYEGKKYVIQCYYKQAGTSGLYRLERCNGLEG